MIPLVARGIASLAGRMIARNPRLGKKIFDLLKKPKGITRVWRGVEPAHKGLSMLSMGAYPKGLKGRFFTTNLHDAKWYAHRKGTKSGLVQYLDLPKKQFNIGTKLSERLNIPSLGGQVIIPKKYLASGKISTDYIKTIEARLRSLLGEHLNKGGLAGVLKL
jgi:hypothetical protein